MCTLNHWSCGVKGCCPRWQGRDNHNQYDGDLVEDEDEGEGEDEVATADTVVPLIRAQVHRGSH